MLFQIWRRSYSAQMASPNCSTRSWLVLAGPSSSYMQTSGLPVSSSVRATTALSASLSQPAASLSRGAAHSSAQFSTTNMKPSAQIWPNEGISPSSGRSSSGSDRMAPRMSMASGWKVRSSSSVFTSASSWVRISSMRRPTSSRKRACCAASLNTSISGSGWPSAASSVPPSPSSMGSHSAAGTSRRVQISAVRKPSQNSHCGISSPRVRSSSSRSSSSSSASGVRAGSSGRAVASWASLDMAEISRENRGKEPATASPSNEWPAV